MATEVTPHQVDPLRVLEVIQRDNPQVLERAMLIVHIQDIELDRERMRQIIDDMSTGAEPAPTSL